jgi:hypothetical protein
LNARLTTLLSKKLLLRNPKKRKPDGLLQRNLAESSKEGRGSKIAVTPVMMMIIIIIT